MEGEGRLELLLRALEVALVLAAGVIVAVTIVGRLRQANRESREFGAEISFDRERDQARAEFLDALRDVASEIGNDLESKAASMRDLLKEADEAIVTLAELIATSEHVQQSAPTAPENTEVGSQEVQGKSREIPGPRAGCEQAPSQKPRAEQVKRSRTYREVRALAADGKRPEEIAKQLGLGTGEVLLVLGLSQKA